MLSKKVLKKRVLEKIIDDELATERMNRNIPVIYGLAFFHSFLVIVPVIVPFFMSKGLSLSEIFYLQAIFATTIVLLEAPSGYVADLFGRKRALLAGAVAHGLGYLLLNFTGDFLGLVVFEITVGIAASLLSGADLAILYDTQKALEDDDNSEHSNVIANLGFFRSGAEALGALLGGFLALLSFDLMVWVQAVAAWMCLLLALLVYEPPCRQGLDPARRVKLLDILRHLVMQDAILRQIVIAIPLYGLASFHVVWLVQPYWQDMGLSLSLFGLLWFAQSLMVAVANRFGFNLERRFGAPATLVVIGVLPVVGHLGMAWLPGWAGIAAGMLIFVGRGLTQVILVNALNRRVPGEFRATANSFVSFLFRLAFITSGPLVGYLAETHGLEATLTMLAAGFVLVFGLVMWPLIQLVRTIKQRAPA
ncbi:MAG: MFS transporter [Pseudohongiellaceae bacterium]